jgi:hypothetical protein
MGITTNEAGGSHSLVSYANHYCPHLCEGTGQRGQESIVKANDRSRTAYHVPASARYDTRAWLPNALFLFLVLHL